MDPVTHTLLGAAIGEGFFSSRLGRRAVVVSAVAANLPDIDGLVMLTGDPGSIILRRSFGHSLFLLPVWIAGLTWLFKRKYDDLETRDIGLIVAVNCLGHLLFDLINSFGVQLFWPFSTARPELALIFIIDLTLLGFLAMPQLARLKESWRPKVPALSRAAIVGVALYLLMAFSARQIALSLLADATNGTGWQYAFPEPLGAWRWRGVVKGADEYKVYLVDTSKRTVEQRLSVPNDEYSPAARAAAETAFGERLLTFFKAPVWRKEPTGDGGWVVTVNDLRFSSILIPRTIAFTFTFDVPKGGPAKARGIRIW